MTALATASATTIATVTAGLTTPAATPAAAAAFWAAPDATPTLRRGFETALWTAIGAEILTAAEICARLTDSGEYHRVAPAAATNRPLKPINFLLKTWAAQGLLRRTA